MLLTVSLKLAAFCAALSQPLFTNVRQISQLEETRKNLLL